MPMHFKKIIIYYLMKIANLLVCFLLVLSINSQALTITYVSTLPNLISSNLQGSLRGGTLLYIKALNFSPMPTDNTITVGKYPCKIPADGVTDTFLVCITADTMQNADIKNLPIKIVSGGQTIVTASPYLFSYVNAKTPELYDVSPTSSIGGASININGMHRILNLGDGRDMGNVISIKIGQDLCSRFDIIQDSQTSATAIFPINCIQSSDQ